MFGSKSFRLLIVVVTVSCLSSLASAGTIRDDRQDSLYLNLGASPEYASVGQIGFTDSLGGSWLASGVLIAPNWVLTAAHVVSDAASLDFYINGYISGQPANVATKLIAHPKWNGNLLNGYDIGLVELSTEITDIPSAPLYTSKKEVGQIGTSVGFGSTGTGVTGAGTFDWQKRAGNNVIDALLQTTGKPRIFLSDFDNPQNPADNWWGSPTPLDLEYLIARGDSGGGVFINVDGTDYLAGIHSFITWRDGLGPEYGDSDYGDGSGHTRVSAFNKWIDSVIGGDGGNGNGHGGGRPPWAGGPGGAHGLASPVPEPSTLCLLCIGGLCLMVGCRWRKRKR